MDLSEDLLFDILDGRPFRYFDVVGSTNDEAMNWLKNGAFAGSVVIADQQSKGRGRLGRSWFAPSGTALMFSFVLHPNADQLPFVSMAGALAVGEVAESFGANASIKWPNDIQIDGRKLCGVLPESAWDGDQLLGVVLGIGVNVRIDFTETPFAETAVSLETVVGAVARASLLAQLLERLDFWGARLSTDQLYDAWHSRLNMIGRNVTIKDIRGVAESVDRQGALHIRDDAGSLQRVIAGDIALG